MSSGASLLLAVFPIVLLLGLVLWGRLSTGVNAAIATGTTALVGALAFGAGSKVLAVAAGKGVWTGIWILYVIGPALLLYQVALRGGLNRIGDVLARVLPSRMENILILAWVLPSFVQGVAGFGTPIAVAAPLLVSLGVPKIRAVALPLVGYHWSVTFGSMGSSFYMGALTANLTDGAFDGYAALASLMLAVQAMVAGVLVCLLVDGWRGLRDGARVLLTVGPVMGITLVLAARVEPSIASLSAGAAGLVAVAVLRTVVRKSAARPTAVVTTTTARGSDSATGPLRGRPAGGADVGSPNPVVVLLPYVWLLVLVLAVFVPPPLRAWAKSSVLIGPSFPATLTGAGVSNPAVTDYTPIALFGHPGTFILAAAALGIVCYRYVGVWPAGEIRQIMAPWSKQVRRSSVSVLALATLATLMVDTGMVRTIADGAATSTGGLFPLLAPVIGALGSFTTGSTTTSNALFAALQRDVATLIGVAPARLVAAQTVGGNVGNVLAPVVVIVGASALDVPESVGRIIRVVLWPVAVLLASAILMVALATLAV